MRVVLCAAVIATVCACAGRENNSYAFRTAPNPNGCYAELFLQEQFKGDGDYVNGPWRIPNLRADRRWASGVRSIRTGPATTVTVWSEQSYRGSLLRIGPAQRNVRLMTDLGETPASLQISCN